MLIISMRKAETVIKRHFIDFSSFSPISHNRLSSSHNKNKMRNQKKINFHFAKFSLQFPPHKHFDYVFRWAEIADSFVRQN